MLTTTLNRLKEQPFDENNWEELLTFLGKTGPDDEPLPLAAVMEAIDVYDAAGALATVPGHDAAVRLFACACLRRILDHSEKKHPRYKQPGKTLMAVEAFIRGEIFPEELRRAEEKLDAAYLRFRGRVTVTGRPGPWSGCSGGTPAGLNGSLSAPPGTGKTPFPGSGGSLPA